MKKQTHPVIRSFTLPGLLCFAMLLVSLGIAGTPAIVHANAAKGSLARKLYYKPRGGSLRAPKTALANQRVLWLGDSITQDGKYVTFIEYYLSKEFPSEKFDIVSVGLSSETVSGLSEKTHPFPRPDVHERLQRAIELVKPTIVVACYGMNDGIYHPQSPERMRAFQDGIRSLITSVRAAKARLLLLTPPPFDPKPILKKCRPIGAPDYGYSAPYEDYDKVLADYSHWELGLPKSDAQVIDLHTELSNYLRQQRVKDPNFNLSTDGIHPSPAGHVLMAQLFLRGIGMNVRIDDPVQETARIGQDPLLQLIREQREKRSAGWLSFIGYTRGQVVKSDSVDSTEKTNAALQQRIDDLRRVH